MQGRSALAVLNSAIQDKNANPVPPHYSWRHVRLARCEDLTKGKWVNKPWLMPKYGMALDNVRSFDMVDATGAVVRAAADENPDLFWALRGGGGNFGVVGSFEFELHEVGPTIFGGLVAWPFTEAGKVLRFFRDFAVLRFAMCLVSAANNVYMVSA